MSIVVTPPTSATQRARWTHQESDGREYAAAVTRTRERDWAGRTGWAWELSYLPAEGVGFHYTGAAPSDLIYSHDDDPARVLGTLSSFVDAWAEALAYGREDGDNRDIFPASCEPFADVAEEFYLATSDLLGDE